MISMEDAINNLEDKIEDNNKFFGEIWHPILKNNLDKGDLISSVTYMSEIIKKQNKFIMAVMPLLEAEHRAQHMLDGFGGTKPRPIDKLLADARNLIETIENGGDDVD